MRHLIFHAKLLFCLTSCLFIFALCGCSDAGPEAEEPEDYTRYVNPFIGTGGTGHTFPGAAWPMGLVQLSPNTGNFKWEYHSGYQFSDTTLRGFAHTHLSGGGNPALGDLLILPFTDDRALTESSLPFDKEREAAQPGYYRTYLPRDGILAELTVTPRTGVHRYTLDKGGRLNLLINLDEVLFRGDPEQERVSEAWFRIADDTLIFSYQRSQVKRTDRKVYHAVHFSRPFDAHRFLDEEQRRLVLYFDLQDAESLEIRAAISGTGPEGARMNLETESQGRSFDGIRVAAREEWQRYLSKIRIRGTPGQKEQFYTCMYHTFIHPNNIADADGRYRGADDRIHTAPKGNEMYSTFPFWDKYRAADPLYTILIPDKVGIFINSILRHHAEKGYLPVWPLWGQDTHTMIGNHSVPVIADAVLKGIEGIDGEAAFEAVKTTLTRNSWHKYDWTLYDRYGYLPFDTVRSESVSRTLEAVYDDWATARLAESLEKSDDHAFFMRRSEYYKNLFDPSTGFMRGKDRNGNWRKPFNPLLITYAGDRYSDYTEGNAWQYTWHVQHDVAGLIGLMGGRDVFTAKLDSLFDLDTVKIGENKAHDVSGLIGQYAHGNEPSQHVAYLYNYCGQPHKTQEKIRQILETMYLTTPEGYCGNNDFGQMSAWYILSSLGFYPVDPVSGMFDLGIPAHPVAVIDPGEEEFRILARGWADGNNYVKSVHLNGRPVDGLQISYADIMKGGELVFTMTDTPVE